MRVPIRAALVLATASTTVSLAACGIFATAPPTSRPSAHSGGIKPTSVIPGPPAGSRAEAAALARLMLSRLRLPAGARRLPQKPVPPLLAGGDVYAVGPSASLDTYELFKLPATMDDAIAALAAHVPVGMYFAGGGHGTGPNGATSEVGFIVRSVPATVDSGLLALTVTPDPSGGSLLRADAQVIWYPPRTAAEYIDPARYHALSITLTIFNPKLHTIRRVITSQAAIARLADAVNQSRAEPPIFFGCPSGFAVYQLAFAVSRQSAPAVVVSTPSPPCGGAQISVGGRAQPPLQDAQAMIAVADQLIGVTPHP